MQTADRVADRFELETVLGMGSFSVVWRALDTNTGERVALKIGRPRFAGSTREAQAADELRREATILAQLTHPNIVRVHAAGEHDGLPYIVMDYLDGISLRDTLRSVHRLEEAEAVALGVRVAGALDAAHRMGILHNDIKPENIILVRGEPVLIDFGVSRDLNATLLPEEATTVSGTLAYLAPELLSGERASPSSDIYALAAMLHECVTGAVPRPGAAPPVGVTPRVADVLRRALSPSPRRRFGSAGEFAAALNSGWQPTVTFPVPGARGRRRWRARAIAAGFAILAIGAASALVRENLRPEGESAQAAGETTPAANPTRPRPSPTPQPTQTPEPTPTPEPSVIDQVTRSIGDGVTAAGEQANRALEEAGRTALDGLGRARDGLSDLADSTGDKLNELKDRWSPD